MDKWLEGVTAQKISLPEEAARMCAILGVDPAEILTDQLDIDKVAALLEAERPKKNSARHRR